MTVAIPPPVAKAPRLPLAQLCIAWVTAPPVAVRPPSMTYCAPVIAEARSEHRNGTVLAISSGMTYRPIGIAD